MAKYLDNNGLLYLWGKIKAAFVAKEVGKGLSTNDFTTTEKNKLSGIAAGANKTVVEDVITSSSATNALSANQGRLLSNRIDAIDANIENLGNGDMLKSVYDTNGDGIVDKAANATQLNGQPASFYAKASDIPVVTNDLTDELMTNYNAAYAHSQAAHAPSNAERNVFVTIKKNGQAVNPDSTRAVDISVPTKTSQLTNDSGFLTTHIDISGKADKATTLMGYGITNAYTKGEVDSAISTAVANSGHLKRLIVESLPDVKTADANTIYMVLEDNGSGDNKYVEYMAINGAWEKTGDSTVDLSGYLKKTDMVAITNADIDSIVAP